jgi:hypothetical protein
VVKKHELEGASFHQITDAINLMMKAQTGWLIMTNKEFRSSHASQNLAKTTAIADIISSNIED